MLKILPFFLCVSLWLNLSVIAQSIGKIPLYHSVYDNWKDLARPTISPDGQLITFEINPQKGDGFLHLQNLLKGRHDSISRGQEAVFSSTSDLFAFKIKQPEGLIHKLKLSKTKKEDLPKDSLGIFLVRTDSLIRIPRLKWFQIPKEGGSWMAYLQDKPKKIKDTLCVLDSCLSKAGLPKDSVPVKSQDASKNVKVKKLKKGAFDEVETSLLTITNPVTGAKFIFENVTEAAFSKNGAICSFITLKKDSTDSTSVQLFDTRILQAKKIYESPGLAKKTLADDKGQQLAFLVTKDTTKVKRFELRFWSEKNGATFSVADTSTIGIPLNWEVSENGKLSFSEDGSKLYFGTAPKLLPQPKDTLLEEEKTKVDIWNWQDGRLQSQQIKELDNDLKKSYLAEYRISDRKVIQMADTLVSRINTIQKGNGDLAIGYANKRYEKLTSWEDASYHDIYLLNLKTGSKKQIMAKKTFTTDISPDGKYIFWYEAIEKSWYIMDLATSQKRCLTCNVPVAFYDEKYDMPSLAGPYGIAGWTKDDQSVLIYDQFDIWQFDPKGIKNPVNITQSGRESRISYRYINLDPEALNIDPGKPLVLKATEENTCKQGFVNVTLSEPGSLINRGMVDQEYSTPILSKNRTRLIWQRSSYINYPDLWCSNTDFSNEKQLSIANPQQSKYLWGTVEKVKWTSLEGKELKGLLYKPENFDASKKYPMIVYFYERYSDKINTHYVPAPTRSIVNFPYYNSNGYLVFVPDITYATGHPGQDAYSSIMSGTLEMMKRPYVDAKNMALQGQSWGGYQTAYMVTRTGLFKAAMAGAPVSNMTSAYGGIRWESGMVREFQYEQSQSRIGGTLWDKRELYIENSPIFFVDQITTPLLIMSNDNDGAVPWYQGIELFTALRRLSKQAWLLCYNGDEHNLTKRPNRQDLSVRMSQFFDHFLKDGPMPKWMKEGIPAVKKGKDTGYEQ